MMKALFVLLTVSSAWSRGLPEEPESVVSIYTTPSSAGTAPALDVYSQIASNLAERISLPFYRFFGFNSSTTKRPFEHLELLEPAPEENTTKDREELSDDALSRPEKKPEKIILYTSYLPVKDKAAEVKGNLEANDTISSNEIDEFEFDVEDENDQGTSRGPYSYLIDLVGRILQLLWGGFLAIFWPSNTNEYDS